jgi:hypothetical protein
MPMTITGRPSRYPKATKPANHLWEALGAVGGGMLAVLTAILGRDSAVACDSHQDVVH